jgi:hypothetical protein
MENGLQEYEYEVTLRIKITTPFGPDDAKIIIQDYLGVGPMDDFLDILSSEAKQIKKS